MRLLLTPLLAASALLTSAGCDTTPPARKRDAAAPGAQLQRQSQTEVAVRVDIPNGGSPSVSVLAYRAFSTGVGADEVLGIVDPLVSLAPDSGCVRRDVAGAARVVGDRGGKVELESLTCLRFDVGAGLPALRPLPRVYPVLASAVHGVIGEAGPIDMAAAPQTLGISDELGNPNGLGSLTVELPMAPRLFDSGGHALGPNPTFALKDLADDQPLELGLTGPESTFVELRPFGATWALACAASDNRVSIPAEELGRLADLRVPLSLEAVAREPHIMVIGGAPARVTLEVRTSSVIKLRP